MKDEVKDQIRSALKVSRKTFFDPYAWLGVNSIVASHQIIERLVKDAMAKPVAGKPETFDEAMKRQGLSENDVIEGEKTYRTYALVFLILGVVAASYMLYLVIKFHSLWGFLLSFSSAALFLAQAFKYDFWALQMRRRTLGLTFTDWKNSYFGSKG